MTVLEEPDEGLRLAPTLVVKHPDIGLTVKNPGTGLAVKERIVPTSYHFDRKKRTLVCSSRTALSSN